VAPVRPDRCCHFSLQFHLQCFEVFEPMPSLPLSAGVVFLDWVRKLRSLQCARLTI
jgi:hypothetical protein